MKQTIILLAATAVLFGACHSGTQKEENSSVYNEITTLKGDTTIYGLAFAEAGNAWYETRKFNPFDMKRSAGVGVRIFLPMVGLMGIDWAYGFDKVLDNNSYKKGGSQFHFILGQEF